MSLATVNAAGQPSARIVLLKGVKKENRRTPILADSSSSPITAAARPPTSRPIPRAGMSFFWAELERQVVVEGVVHKASREEAAGYFRTRPLGSQLGAWASQQSQIVPSRDWLEEKLEAVAAEYAGREVPVPPLLGRLLGRSLEHRVLAGRPRPHP